MEQVTLSSTSRPDGAETSSGCPSHFPLNQSAQARTPQPDGRRRLKLLLKVNRRLSTAYPLKEEFGQLGDYEREGLARRFFENSLKWQRLKPYEKFAEMMTRHWDGITAYCQPENKVALGFVEGREHQDPRHSAADLRLTRRRVPAPENPHLHTRPDMKSGRNHPLTKEKSLINRPLVYANRRTANATRWSLNSYGCSLTTAHAISMP